MRLKRPLPILILFCFGASFHQVARANPCFDFLNQKLNFSSRESGNSATVTDGLIAYLDLLLEKQVLSEQSLGRLIESLLEGHLINPIDEREADLKSELYEHFKGIKEYVGREDLDLNKILEWALERSKEKEKENKDRRGVERETKDRIYQEIEWGAVPAGSFMMGEEGNRVSVTLTHPFEAMTTPVTQKMWVEVMGKNPSHFADGENSILVNINGELVKMQPDNPVENITWWSALVFANRLSELHGLKPVYDLSRVQWMRNNEFLVEDGNLRTFSQGEIKINVPDEDYYRAEGYRLPTEAEQEYLLRARGTAKGRYYFEENEEEIRKHAWGPKYSEKTTHPVAELKPLRIQRSDGESVFYDLVGNVYEWSWDSWGELKGGINPVNQSMVLKLGMHRVARGGSWKYLDSRYLEKEEGRPYDFGFRLVRTLDVGEEK